MKDIYTILGEIGLTVPEEKKSAFDTAVRENYKTVSEHDKVVRARDDYKSQLDTANNTISELEKNKGDVASLQSQIDTYKQEKADREKAEQEAQKNAAYMARFEKLHGERTYTNEFTKNGVFAEFKEALGKPENEGKSDADIFAALTKDRDGIFTNPNPGVDIPGMGNNQQGSYSENDKLSDSEFYARYYANKNQK
ncbi:MAG: phage scaffolding protein [Clostridia bacterium]|nr:phage scaffolding protein [Clostridia bacterium]